MFVYMYMIYTYIFICICIYLHRKKYKSTCIRSPTLPGSVGGGSGTGGGEGLEGTGKRRLNQKQYDSVICVCSRNYFEKRDLGL